MTSWNWHLPPSTTPYLGITTTSGIGTSNGTNVSITSNNNLYVGTTYATEEQGKNKNKFDIPVGALVFVKTRDFYHNVFSSGGWNISTAPAVTWLPTYTTINITPNGFNSLNGTSGLGYTPKYTPNTNTAGGFNYGVTSSPATKSAKKPKKGAKKLKSSSVASTLTTVFSSSNAYTYQLNGNTNFGASAKTISNLNGITSNTKAYPATPTYQVRGYKTVDDYLMKSWEVVFVTQQENEKSEQELHTYYDEKGEFPEFGKPFHGLVVDKLLPRITTECGAIVELEQPILYKVLVNETNCLWIEETELLPMKPEECPIKEGFEQEEKELK